MDPLSYLAQTEQQLSFIIAREGRQGGRRARNRDDSPTGLIKESDIIGGGGGRRRGGGGVSGVFKVLTDRDTAAILSGLFLGLV